MTTRENFEKELAKKYNNDFKLYEIGNIQIVKYWDDKDCDICFRPYINYKSTIFIFHDLEQAIVHAIARKHDGPNTRADEYFWKMIS